MSLLDNDSHVAARELTSLKSELHEMKRDLERRIFDVEMRLSWWRLYAFWAVCTITMILFLGAQKLLR
jgi:hypothetical protein